MSNTSQQSRPAAEQFELVVRFQQPRSSQPSDGAARSRAQALVLVQDILVSRLEVDPTSVAQDYVHTRGFLDLGKALAASRALQVAFEGFRDALPSGRASLSVVLDSSAEEGLSGHSDFSVEQKELLDSAKPSQVLLTQAFYEKVAHYQPALRSFPLRGGVYEFLWTSEERLNELQAEAEFMPTLVADAVPNPAPGSTAAEPPAGTPPEPPPAEGIWRPKQRVSEPDDREAKPGLSRPRITAISSAVALLAGIGYLAISHTSSGHPSPAVVPKAPVVSLEPATSRPSAPATADKTPQAPVPQVTTTIPTTPPVIPKPAPRVHECAISGLVPDYLKLAETNRNNGQYEAAIRQYTAVLGCEPGNREAREGLQRTRDAERLSGSR